MHLSINEAAAELGCDRRTLTKRLAEAGVRPSGRRQGYPVFRLRELIELERTGVDGNTDPEKLNPVFRHAYYKGESERLKVNRERGKLIHRDQYERELARVLKAISLELDTVSDEVERDVGASGPVLEKVEQKIDLVRKRMYESITTPQEEPETDDDGDGDAPDTVP